MCLEQRESSSSCSVRPSVPKSCSYHEHDVVTAAMTTWMTTATTITIVTIR